MHEVVGRFRNHRLGDGHFLQAHLAGHEVDFGRVVGDGTMARSFQDKSSYSPRPDARRGEGRSAATAAVPAGGWLAAAATLVAGNAQPLIGVNIAATHLRRGLS